MQQYYPTNLDNDPGRMMYSKTEELLPKKNIFNRVTSVFKSNSELLNRFKYNNIASSETTTLSYYTEEEN